MVSRRRRAAAPPPEPRHGTGAPPTRSAMGARRRSPNAARRRAAASAAARARARAPAAAEECEGARVVRPGVRRQSEAVAAPPHGRVAQVPRGGGGAATRLRVEGRCRRTRFAATPRRATRATSSAKAGADSAAGSRDSASKTSMPTTSYGRRRRGAQEVHRVRENHVHVRGQRRVAPPPRRPPGRPPRRDGVGAVFGEEGHDAAEAEAQHERALRCRAGERRGPEPRV